MSDVTQTPGERFERRRLTVVSTRDAAPQTCYLHRPAAATGPRPLVVSLHTWSFNVEQRNEPLEGLCAERDWLLLYPDFRGPNNRPAACGSTLAQQDILDAVAHVQAHYAVDPQRVYLCGTSGGGHLTMLMAGRHPAAWTAASAWVGISDLAAWHARHAGGEYGEQMRAACGGAPGDSPAVDAQYAARSPLTWLSAAVDLPLDLAAGIHDGHTGSVPIRHTLDAFNTVARAQGAPEVSETEIAQLSQPDGRLAQPQPSDQVTDPSFGRTIHLRRQAGRCRVTIFEGGHEGIARAAVAWFEAHPGR